MSWKLLVATPLDVSAVISSSARVCKGCFWRGAHARDLRCACGRLLGSFSCLETLASNLKHAGARFTIFHQGTECGFENAFAKRRPDGGIATARLFSPDPRVADLVDGLATLVLDRTFRAARLPLDHPNATDRP
jgi:hypothetical protein